MEDGFRLGRAASSIFYHPKTQVRVVVHGDDFTFAGTESELKRIQAKMHGWYDVKVRGVLGSGKRDVHEIEILGMSLTWTEEGLEYEGSDKHRPALLEGLGLNEESKAVNSAAVKPQEIGQEEDTEMLDAPETKRFRSLAATLNYMSSDRSDVQYAAKEVCTKMANPTRGSWKMLKKGRQILERSRESDVEDGSMEKQRGGECGRACGFELSQWAREEVDEWMNDDDQRHGRETLVQNASDACVEHGRSRVLRSRHGCSVGTWNRVDDGRLGRRPPKCEFGLIPMLPPR